MTIHSPTFVSWTEDVFSEREAEPRRSGTALDRTPLPKASTDITTAGVLVTRGAPDESELAALVAGLAAALQDGNPAPTPSQTNATTRWVRSTSRQLPMKGRDDWRWSLR